MVDQGEIVIKISLPLSETTENFKMLFLVQKGPSNAKEVNLG